MAIGCLSFLPNDWEGQPAWQLRGMATAPSWRAKGVGRGLLEYAEGALRAGSPIRRLWCNARTGAAEFYEKQGWQYASSEFEIAGVGPHFRMTKVMA
jgi:GNAT superfamily N-acetyltransferase